jgi:ribosomal-protein-alanine N-acetyltransferase
MSSAEIQVRRMDIADLDRVMEIAQNLGAAPHWPPAAYREVLAPVAGPPRIALVAIDPYTNAVAGFAVVSLVAPQAELETIVVAADRQRRGVGRRLMRALTVELRLAAVVEILLEVRASNQPALAFYRRLGFLETGRRPRYYADPEEDAVLMSLHLDADAL